MTEFKENPSIVFADSFFESMRNLPYKELKETTTLLKKFLNDPTARSLNYEKLESMDPSIRSVRVNRAYRVIIKAPEKEQQHVYTFLWVDSHDDAYDWAKRKQIRVNSTSRMVEVYDSVLGDEGNWIQEAQQEANEEERLFDKWSRQELKDLGVREEFFFILDAIKDLEMIEKAKRFLPSSIYEILSFLANGFPYDEVKEIAITMSPEEELESAQLDDVIQGAMNQHQFLSVQTGEEGHNELDFMALARDPWRYFLHPVQKHLTVKNFSGPAFVTGGAGTGKTVVAIHRALHLLTTEEHDETRLLFTTFTKNLSLEIEKILGELIPANHQKRIKIINVDKLTADYAAELYPERHLIYGDDVDMIWRNIIEMVNAQEPFTAEFCRREYEEIVLGNDIATFHQYKRTARAGMGISLDWKEKKVMWEIIQLYGAEMEKNNKWDVKTATEAVRKEMALKEPRGEYRWIVVDESQDLSASSYRLLRTLAGKQKENDLFMVGDANQNIYGTKVSLKQCGIHLGERIESLHINYRTTGAISQYAKKLIEDNDSGMVQSDEIHMSNSISLVYGKEPKVHQFDSMEEEVKAITNTVKVWIADGYTPNSICIALRTNTLVKSYRNKLKDLGIEAYELKQNKEEDITLDLVRIATMHRIKGLEFDCVVLAGAGKNNLPNKMLINSATDRIHRKQLEQVEKSLIYVAITRARKELKVTSTGPLCTCLDNK